MNDVFLKYLAKQVTRYRAEYSLSEGKSFGLWYAIDGLELEEDEAFDVSERNFLDDLNPDSKRVIRALVEPALAKAAPEERFQFERHGYFVADAVDSKAGAPIFNRTVTLRDSWHKQ